MKLIIVESPTKAKTIQKYLGRDYKVVASKGHIRDLSFNGEKSLGVDVHNGFAPDYVIDQYKQSTINYLKKLTLEKEVLGMYVTGHPLSQYKEVLERNTSIDNGKLNALKEDEQAYLNLDEREVIINL